MRQVRHSVNFTSYVGFMVVACAALTVAVSICRNLTKPAASTGLTNHPAAAASLVAAGGHQTPYDASQNTKIKIVQHVSSPATSKVVEVEPKIHKPVSKEDASGINSGEVPQQLPTSKSSASHPLAKAAGDAKSKVAKSKVTETEPEIREPVPKDASSKNSVEVPQQLPASKSSASRPPAEVISGEKSKKATTKMAKAEPEIQELASKDLSSKNSVEVPRQLPASKSSFSRPPAETSDTKSKVAVEVPQQLSFSEGSDANPPIAGASSDSASETIVEEAPQQLSASESSASRPPAEATGDSTSKVAVEAPQQLSSSKGSDTDSRAKASSDSTSSPTSKKQPTDNQPLTNQQPTNNQQATNKQTKKQATKDPPSAPEPPVKATGDSEIHDEVADLARRTAASMGEHISEDAIRATIERVHKRIEKEQLKEALANADVYATLQGEDAVAQQLLKDAVQETKSPQKAQVNVQIGNQTQPTQTRSTPDAKKHKKEKRLTMSKKEKRMLHMAMKVVGNAEKDEDSAADEIQQAEKDEHSAAEEIHRAKEILNSAVEHIGSAPKEPVQSPAELQLGTEHVDGGPAAAAVAAAAALAKKEHDEAQIQMMTEDDYRAVLTKGIETKSESDSLAKYIMDMSIKETAEDAAEDTDFQDFSDGEDASYGDDSNGEDASEDDSDASFVEMEENESEGQGFQDASDGEDASENDSDASFVELEEDESEESMEEDAAEEHFQQGEDTYNEEQEEDHEQGGEEEQEEIEQIEEEEAEEDENEEEEEEANTDETEKEDEEDDAPLLEEDAEHDAEGEMEDEEM